MVVVNFNTLRIYSVHHIFKRVQKLNKVKNYCLIGGITRNSCGRAFSERALTPTLIFFTCTHTHTHTHMHSPTSTFSSALLVYQVLCPDPPAQSPFPLDILDDVLTLRPVAGHPAYPDTMIPSAAEASALGVLLRYRTNCWIQRY